MSDARTQYVKEMLESSDDEIYSKNILQLEKYMIFRPLNRDGEIFFKRLQETYPEETSAIRSELGLEDKVDDE
tara:strand:+ start:310 stop:528 length:219 start_codon:yes stop_codon:yes gene_type:complete